MSDTTATTSCRTTGGGRHSPAAPGAAATAPVTTVFQVSGMTCGHCEASVAREIGALEGVGAVRVELPTGRVSVTTEGEPDEARIAAAVGTAGYELAGRASEEK
ncbi:heavy-metal-associated domain-containing protein [Streptomyces iconiensis]|uniref:Heavy-metal-associated domain-containing protein n=1 Tax=Streptomyces iconiensis TaxID=1384038 RepID=A0ABT7A964_9ACTN|nr:heavy-metal-associated domain-containing protein [Streptomyces iconiensis]MDJ1137898.1 heavy-metal-associated domain-containing protein [Streptomyces iconiensis]